MVPTRSINSLRRWLALRIGDETDGIQRLAVAIIDQALVDAMASGVFADGFLDDPDALEFWTDLLDVDAVWLSQTIAEIAPKPTRELDNITCQKSLAELPLFSDDKAWSDPNPGKGQRRSAS